MWGSCFWFCTPSASRPPPPPAASSRPSPTCQHTTCPHTTCHHTTWSHTTRPHLVLTPLVITQLDHTQLVHTPLVLTQLVHTQLVHTQIAHTRRVLTPLANTQLVHTQLVHTQLVLTQLVLTQLAHTQLVHTQLAQTQLVLTQLAHTQLVHTQLAQTQLVLTQLVHTTCPHTTCPHTTCPHTTCPHTTCSHTTCPHTTCSNTTCPHTTCPQTTCYHTTCQHTTCPHTGVALGDIHLRFAWLTPWTPRLFAWQAWHLVTSTFTLRGGCGTWWHSPSFCVAGVALMPLGWHWWRARFSTDAVDAAAVCVAGVALGHIHLHFTWRAWHWCRGGRGCLRGRRGPRLHFTWQACPLATSTITLRGRRGTWWHPPSLCVAGVARMALGWLRRRACMVGVESEDAAAVGAAGVALRDIHLRSTWHLVTSTGHVPLLHHLHFCVHCDMFVLDEIVVPASSVAVWHHIYLHHFASIHPSIHPYIHTCCMHTYMHTYMHTTQLVHTQLTRTYSSTHNLFHTNPSPSLFPFLLSPCHLYLSFAACWKKLTCGVIRSFNLGIPLDWKVRGTLMNWVQESTWNRSCGPGTGKEPQVAISSGPGSWAACAQQPLETDVDEYTDIYKAGRMCMQ